jgi:hypothetical protein
LQPYVEYYQRSRSHLALAKDAPISRTIAHSNKGTIVAIPQLGGLHHHDARRAA